MAGHALPEAKKAQIKQESFERLKAKAIQVYKSQSKKSPNSHKGAQTIATKFCNAYRQETGLELGLNYNAILQGAAGRKSIATFNLEKSWLNPTEVDLVINYICKMGN